MQRDAYHRLTERLREGLSAEARVLGLVALGSMSGDPPAPDEWSDHDFFVITRPGEQERMRTDLSWLPDAGQIALSYRETAHGVKVLYRSALPKETVFYNLATPGEHAETYMRLLMIEARQIVDYYWDMISALATELMKRREMSGRAVAAFTNQLQAGGL